MILNFVLLWKNKGPASFLLFFSATKVPYELRAESMVQSKKLRFSAFLSIWVTIFFCCYKEKMGTNKHLRSVSKQRHMGSKLKMKNHRIRSFVMLLKVRFSYMLRKSAKLIFTPIWAIQLFCKDDPRWYIVNFIFF